MKVRFSKREAQTALNAARYDRKRRKWRREVRYYHCPECNAYHLTSKR